MIASTTLEDFTGIILKMKLANTGKTMEVVGRLTMNNINHPSHYMSGEIECIDALEAATEGLTGGEAFCTANAIKYLWRWKRKNGAEDLQKAKWYIDRILAKLEGP